MKKINMIWLFMIFLIIPLAYSTTVMRLNLSEMTAEADYIGKGIVEKEYSQWEDGKIYTYTVIKVNKNYKSSKDKVVVKTLGGVVDDIAMKVPGQAKFKENDEVLVFLEKKKENVISVSKNLGISKYEAPHTPEYEIVGFSQGKFSIKEENSKKIVHNDETFELGLITQEGVINKEFKSIPLEEFEKQIYKNLGYEEKQSFFQIIKNFILKIFSFLR